MASTARTYLNVKSTSWSTAALLRSNAKTGAIALNFFNMPTKASDGSIKAGSAFNVRCYESSDFAGAVGSGTSVIASFEVAAGGQVPKNVILTNGKLLRIEVQGVGPNFKEAEASVDIMHNGAPFMGQVDIEIHGGKSGMGYIGHGQPGVASGASPTAWPESESAGSE